MKNIGLILALLNTLAIAGVGGYYYYTKKIFKRPSITESAERAKLEATQAALAVPTKGERVMVALPPLTANLDSYTNSQGKSATHFASIKLVAELRDKSDEASFSAVLPVVMDQIIQNLSKKKFDELNQVQGRYLFRSQIIDGANQYLKAPVVTEIYFSDFLLQ